MSARFHALPWSSGCGQCSLPECRSGADLPRTGGLSRRGVARAAGQEGPRRDCEGCNASAPTRRRSAHARGRIRFVRGRHRPAGSSGPDRRQSRCVGAWRADDGSDRPLVRAVRTGAADAVPARMAATGRGMDIDYGWFGAGLRETYAFAKLSYPVRGHGFDFGLQENLDDCMQVA